MDYRTRSSDGRCAQSYRGPAKPTATNGSISDGGGNNLLAGYTVIEAPNLDAAVKLAKSCPQLASGGSIQVAETFDVM